MTDADNHEETQALDMREVKTAQPSCAGDRAGDKRQWTSKGKGGFRRFSFEVLECRGYVFRDDPSVPSLLWVPDTRQSCCSGKHSADAATAGDRRASSLRKQADISRFGTALGYETGQVQAGQYEKLQKVGGITPDSLPAWVQGRFQPRPEPVGQALHVSPTLDTVTRMDVRPAGSAFGRTAPGDVFTQTRRLPPCTFHTVFLKNVDQNYHCPRQSPNNCGTWFFLPV